MKNVIKSDFLLSLYALLFGKKRKRYRKLLMDYIDGENIIWFHNMGSSNLDKKFIYISAGDSKYDDVDIGMNGFFSLLDLYAIRKLDVAERYGMIPYIYWGEKSIYFESRKINGTNNVFEYYFKQPVPYKKEDILSSRNVCMSFETIDVNIVKGNNIYEPTEKELNRYAYLFSKYISLNDVTRRYIEEEISKLKINQDTLGIHIRGVDWGNVRNHPVPVEIEDYVKEIDNLGKEYKNYFLATDSEETLERMKKIYGDKLIYFKDVTRTRPGSKQLTIFEEEKEGYQLGKEVLRDMYALVASGGIIAGLSNVSFTARYVKRSLGKRFQNEIILNKGICKSGLNMKQYERKLSQWRKNS